ncbi:MAG: flagellar basal body L-ring protein FlgH [Myxococcota bacterium]
MRLLLVAVVFSAGCVRHIHPYEPKHREYTASRYASPDAARTAGSLWSEGSAGLFEDPRARRVGDIVTVKVDEQSDATRDASTTTSRSSSRSLGVTSFLGAMTKLAAANPEIDPASLFEFASEADFEGGGQTSRRGAVSATMPVRIQETLPNGDFFIEGSKVLLINDEETFLYLSGVVRPIDIGPDNAVMSSMLADVELELTGRGVISERQTPGFFDRFLDVVWPF